MKTKGKLVREQLETTLRRFQPLNAAPIPAKGWVRAIRNALGMSGRQMAWRAGVSKQRASFNEKQELDGSATLKTMRKAAEALDCVFVYGFVPITSLEETVQRQAELVASKRLARASHTMILEDQTLRARENQEILRDMILELAETTPKNLWDA